MRLLMKVLKQWNDLVLRTSGNSGFAAAGVFWSIKHQGSVMQKIEDPFNSIFSTLVMFVQYNDTTFEENKSITARLVDTRDTYKNTLGEKIPLRLSCWTETWSCKRSS